MKEKGIQKLVVLSCAGARAALAPAMLFACFCRRAGHPYFKAQPCTYPQRYACGERAHKPSKAARCIPQGLGPTSWCFVCPFFIYASLPPEALQQGCRVTSSTAICRGGSHSAPLLPEHCVFWVCFWSGDNCGFFQKLWIVLSKTLRQV